MIMRASLKSALVGLLLLALHFAPASGGGGNKCSTGTSYSCPNCGGIIQVEDCLDCIGFLSTDNTHNMCIDRKLFQPYNDDTTDFENHYHYLVYDLVGAFVWFVMAGVATACGVGGGGIYVPLGILLFQFSPKQASGLSQASIFGASLGGLLLNSRNRHPCTKIRSDPGVVPSTEEEEEVEGGEDDTNNHSGVDSAATTKEEDKTNSTSSHSSKEEEPSDERALLVPESKEYEEKYLAEGNQFYTRPLINYDMALFLSPMEMAGAVLGVLIQRILPNWLYLAISGVVLSFTAYKTYKKFFAVRQKEKAEEKQQKAKEQDKGDESSSSCHIESAVSVGKGIVNDDDDDDDEEQKGRVDLEAVSNDDSTAPVSSPEQPQTVQQQQEELKLRKQYLADDMRQYPREKIVALVILWIGLFLLTLFKGGKGVESLVGITCESPWYIVLIVLQFLWMFGFALWFGVQLVKKQNARVKVHYPYLPDDPVWDKKALRFYGSFTFVAGIVAGLIGIGGGMVLGPLMLVMGINPRVSSATTATMIVLTSSSVAVIFVTSGLVPWSYAVFYFFVCFAGAIFGKRKIDGYVKRTGRASLLIFILASIILFATIGVLVIMFTRLAEKGWCLDGFNKFCVVDDDETCAGRMLANFLYGSGNIESPYNY